MSADRDHGGSRSRFACNDDSCQATVIHARTRWFTMNCRDHSLFSTCKRILSDVDLHMTVKDKASIPTESIICGIFKSTEGIFFHT